MIAKSTTNWTSFQGNRNQKISFVRYHRQQGGGKPPSGKMKNMLFSDEILSKLCADGAIQNLVNMLQIFPEDMIFWGELDTSDLLTLMKSLNESFVPKAVLTPSLEIDLIQKCMWILRKKF